MNPEHKPPTDKPADRTPVRRSAYAVGFAICQVLLTRAKPYQVLVGTEIRTVRGLILVELMGALREEHTRGRLKWTPPKEPTTIRRACNDLKGKGLICRAAIPQDRLPPFALFYLPDHAYPDSGGTP